VKLSFGIVFPIKCPLKGHLGWLPKEALLVSMGVVVESYFIAITFQHLSYIKTNTAGKYNYESRQ
jgi:hypothetical protein